jgi:anti-anti-sigma regulatory factor
LASKFHAAVQRTPEETRIRFGGVVDEDEELGSVLEQIQPGPVVIDLADVERINSLGVRQWIYWISEVERRGGVPVMTRCSRAIMAQINLINNFTGTQGAVRSFYAPYFCETCDREQQLLVDVSDLQGPPYHAPRVRCEACDHMMEFDDIEEGYFAFLSRPRQPPPPGSGTPARGLADRYLNPFGREEPLLTPSGVPPSMSSVRRSARPTPAPPLPEPDLPPPAPQLAAASPVAKVMLIALIAALVSAAVVLMILLVSS